jgi:hypothetical protein
MAAALSGANASDQPRLMRWQFALGGTKLARQKLNGSECEQWFRAHLPRQGKNGPGGEGSRPGPHPDVQVLTGLIHRDFLKGYLEGKSTVSITWATPFD